MLIRNTGGVERASDSCDCISRNSAEKANCFCSCIGIIFIKTTGPDVESKIIV